MNLNFQNPPTLTPTERAQGCLTVLELRIRELQSTLRIRSKERGEQCFMNRWDAPDLRDLVKAAEIAVRGAAATGDPHSRSYYTRFDLAKAEIKSMRARGSRDGKAAYKFRYQFARP